VNTVSHDLAFRAAGQFDAVEEHVSWIDVSFTRIAIARVLVAVVSVVRFAIRARPAPQFDPGHVDVSRLVALHITRIRIMVHKNTSVAE
jgi:hypothetical protein